MSFANWAKTSTTGASTAVNASCAIEKDVQVQDGPSDSISALAFSPASDHLAVSSWDNSVRIYEVGQSGAVGRAAYGHEAPVLDVCWSHDGLKAFSGGVDNAGRMLDVQTGASSQVAQHASPIKGVRWTDMHGGLLVTGSWDKTLKYWDLRTPSAIASLDLVERCYSMDLAKNMLVVATAERRIQLIDLNNPGAFAGEPVESPLKFSTRCIAVSPDATSYAIGGIEGRVGIHFTPEVAPKVTNYSFRCHRAAESLLSKKNAEEAQIFTTNALAFHPFEGSCATVGSDGGISIWDINNKKLLKAHDFKQGNVNLSMPLTAAAFSRTNGGKILAYAASYDWSRGYKGNVPGHVNKIMLHALTDTEIKKRPKI